MKTSRIAFLIFCISAVFMLWRLHEPQFPYYDEPQYINSARALLSGAPNTNPEAPPLGKILIAIGMQALGDHPWGWRVMSVLFGAATLAGVFVWAEVLLQDRASAWFATLLTALNHFVYVMSRIAMMDIFLVTFMIWGLAAFTAVLGSTTISVRRRRWLMLLSGCMFGLACACKWNGVDELAVVWIVSGFLLFFGYVSGNETYRQYRRNLSEAGLLTMVASFLVLPVLAYAITFLPLYYSAHRPFRLQELIYMNLYIWEFHRSRQFSLLIASPWFSWVFQFNPQRGLSYLVGNWAVMWGGVLALIYALRRFGRSFPHSFLVLLYGMNMLQWALTPQKQLYYYYYFPAAMVLGVAIALALQELPKRIRGVRLSLLYLVAALVIFIYCFPRMAHLQSPFDCALGCWN